MNTNIIAGREGERERKEVEAGTTLAEEREDAALHWTHQVNHSLISDAETEKRLAKEREKWEGQKQRDAGEAGVKERQALESSWLSAGGGKRKNFFKRAFRFFFFFRNLSDFQDIHNFYVLDFFKLPRLQRNKKKCLKGVHKKTLLFNAKREQKKNFD